MEIRKKIFKFQFIEMDLYCDEQVKIIVYFINKSKTEFMYGAKHCEILRRHLTSLVAVPFVSPHPLVAHQLEQQHQSA